MPAKKSGAKLFVLILKKRSSGRFCAPVPFFVLVCVAELRRLAQRVKFFSRDRTRISVGSLKLPIRFIHILKTPSRHPAKKRNLRAYTV